MLLILNCLSRQAQFYLIDQERVITSEDYPVSGDDLQAVLKAACAHLGRSASDISKVLYCRGPGSFTGIKTATVVAQAMGLCGAQIYSFTTFDWMQVLLGRTVYATECLLMNAFQGDYFCAKLEGESLVYSVVARENLPGMTQIYWGDERYALPEFLCLPSGSTRQLADIFYQNRYSNVLKPLYLKKSHAEIKQGEAQVKRGESWPNQVI